MPVWHERTKHLIESGELVVLGVIQEQHAERARLYAQWQQFSFPIVQDQMASLGLAAVPIPMFIDEHGVIQKIRPRVNDLDEFVSNDFPAPKLETDSDQSPVKLANAGSPNAICASGDDILKWDADQKIDQAIENYLDAYQQLIDSKDKSKAGILAFRLGTAYRARFDLDAQKGKSNLSDFQNASKYWSLALQANPNQYIWRRRIEQYGPRLEKPYPFYDWVARAEQEIRERGETPIVLQVALSGSEIAAPGNLFSETETNIQNPDPDQEILLDKEKMILVDGVAVPNLVTAGKATRVHLRFTTGEGKWNNEGAPMKIWINGSDEYDVDQQLIIVDNADTASSVEDRNQEFEIRVKNTAKENVNVTGYALYNTCKDETQQCFFRRLEFSISIQIVNAK